MQLSVAMPGLVRQANVDFLQQPGLFTRKVSSLEDFRPAQVFLESAADVLRHVESLPGGALTDLKLQFVRNVDCQGHVPILYDKRGAEKRTLSHSSHAFASLKLLYHASSLFATTNVTQFQAASRVLSSTAGRDEYKSLSAKRPYFPCNTINSVTVARSMTATAQHADPNPH